MSEAARPPTGRLAGAALALAGFLIFHFSVIAVDPALTAGQAGAPWTDGPEYLDAAVSLVRDGAYRIHVAGELHPPRYPFGYSALIAAALACGVEPELAPHRVNQIAGLALLALTALPLWRRGNYPAAGLAVLLLATLPAFVILVRSPLSEVSSAVLTTSGVLFLYRYAGGGTRLMGALGAFLLTSSSCFRTANILLATFVPAAAFARNRGCGRSAWRDLLFLGGLAAAGLAPVLVFNLAAFGDVTKTGYDHWLAGWSQLPTFDVENLGRSLPYYWRELTQRETLFTTADLYGRGSYFGPAFALLVLLALLGRNRSRRFWSFAAAGLLSGGATLLFYFTDARLFFPLFVLATPIAAAGALSLPRLASRPAAIASLLLLAAATVGWPARGGGCETLALLRQATSTTPSIAYRETSRLRRLYRGEHELILTDLPPPYLHAVLPPGPEVAPLTDGHDFRHNPQVFTFGAVERRRLVADAIAAGRPVWALTHARDILTIAEDCPAPAGHVWEIVSRDSPRGGIARLVAARPRARIDSSQAGEL